MFATCCQKSQTASKPPISCKAVLWLESSSNPELTLAQVFLWKMQVHGPIFIPVHAAMAMSICLLSFFSVPTHFFLQLWAFGACHRQSLSGHSHGSRAPNGNWNMEPLPHQLPFPSPPFLCHHLAALPSNKPSSSTPCLGKLLFLTPLESPKHGSRDYSSVGLHNKVTKEAVITEQRFTCI